MKTSFYFGPTDRALFGYYHAPQQSSDRPAANDLGVILVNPIGDDLIRAHRTFRHLAEKLSQTGYAVLRFDFHGTGDSSGSEADTNRLETWQQDIDLAIAELRSRSGVARVCLVGLRLGATLASLSASRRGDIDFLVLWEPYRDGKSYVRESTQLHRMQTLLDPNGFKVQPKDGINGEEALGFLLSHSTIADLEKLDLLACTQFPSQKILVIGGIKEEPLVAHLRHLGAEVEAQHLSHKFLVMTPHQSTLPEQELSAILSWLKRINNEENTATRNPNPCLSPDLMKPNRCFEEEPVHFAGGSLFGISISGKSENVDSDRPAIILVNAGTVHRIGPHRLYVRMAREWAKLGFTVFRMDLSGVGDSPVEPGLKENLCYPRTAVADVQNAMEYLGGRTGANRFILVGLCSGGDIAFKTGFLDPRVVGAVILNPRTFCVHDLQMVEMVGHAHYFQRTLVKKEKWQKLLRGEVNVTRTARNLIPAAAGWVQSKLKKPAMKEELTHMPVPTCLRVMAERGVDTLLVASENDPGMEYVNSHFTKEMRELEGVPRFRRITFQGTNHTFTSLGAQELVLNTVTDHLRSQFLV